jgi:small subunit ribosomal protein S17
MAEKKTDTGKSVPAKKAAAARKPAAKKAAAKKAATKKPVTRKSATKATPAPAAAKKTSAARAKAKAARGVPESIPGRKERRGTVVSTGMQKTVVVRIDTVRAHDRYGKVVRRSTKLHVHDENNTAQVGDFVRVVETRPLSATKRWRLLEILERAK